LDILFRSGRAKGIVNFDYIQHHLHCSSIQAPRHCSLLVVRDVGTRRWSASAETEQEFAYTLHPLLEPLDIRSVRLAAEQRGRDDADDELARGEKDGRVEEELVRGV
jgi:hypothetical protein